MEEEDSLRQPQHQGQAQIRGRGLSRQQWELPSRASNIRQQEGVCSLRQGSSSLQQGPSSLRQVVSSFQRVSSSL